MSDNIIDFPNKELHIEFTPEDFEGEVEDIAVFVQCLLNGLYVTGDMDWEAGVHACFMAASHCAINAGYTAEEFNRVAASVRVEEYAE